ATASPGLLEPDPASAALHQPGTRAPPRFHHGRARGRPRLRRCAQTADRAPVAADLRRPAPGGGRAGRRPRRHEPRAGLAVLAAPGAAEVAGVDALALGPAIDNRGRVTRGPRAIGARRGGRTFRVSPAPLVLLSSAPPAAHRRRSAGARPGCRQAPRSRWP